MNDDDFFADTGEDKGIRRSGIATSCDDNRFVPIEHSVTGCTVVDTFTD